MGYNIAELVEQAYLAGYRLGVESFATWKDGEQVVGCRQLKLRDLLATAIKDIEEPYKTFLRKQEKAYNAREE